MDPEIAKIFNLMLALVLSLSVHEWAHAYVAKLQGDDTAESEGRLTLNPMAHIDPLGTIVLPLVLIVTSGFLLGWAKPVPVDLRNLRNPKWGHALIAAAGPLSNLLVCFVAAIIATLCTNFMEQGTGYNLIMAITGPIIKINAILAVFNLIPLAPLDGGTVFPTFLPDLLRKGYEEYIAPYGSYILLALMISGSLQWVSAIASGYIALSLKFANLLL